MEENVPTNGRPPKVYRIERDEKTDDFHAVIDAAINCEKEERCRALPKESFDLLHACVNGSTNHIGTVPCLIEQDDGPNPQF